MELPSFCETGCSTRVSSEKFFMKCEFPNFQIDEAYREIQDGHEYRTVRKVTIPERSSDRCFIGQSLNFPSYWCVNIRNSEMHAGIGLMYQSDVRSRLESSRRSSNSAYCKFRINIVDKEGDILYEKEWQSWKTAKKIYLGEEHTMPDFIHAEHLFDNRALFMPDNTLRLSCEGILYSELQQIPLTFLNNPIDQTVSPMTLNLWDRDNMEFSDFEIISKDGEVTRAHKLILSSAGPIWRNLIRIANLDTVPDQVSKFHVELLSKSEVVKMLQFIYTGTVNQDWNNFDEVEKLIQLAEHYELRGLKRLCVDRVGSSLSLGSFIKTVKTFQSYFENSEFLPLLNKFLIENKDKLTQQEGFQNFAREDKDAFLEVVLFNGNH